MEIDIDFEIRYGDTVSSNHSSNNEILISIQSINMAFTELQIFLSSNYRNMMDRTRYDQNAMTLNASSNKNLRKNDSVLPRLLEMRF